MANFSKKEKKIYDGLKYEEKILLINHGLSKLLTWSVIFLTVFVSFIQLLTTIRPLPFEDYSISGAIFHVFKNPLWIVGYILLWSIYLVISKILITYGNQLILEYNLPSEVYKILWRQLKRPIGNRFFKHNFSDEKKEFVRYGFVIFFKIIIIIGLHLVFISRFLEEIINTLY